MPFIITAGILLLVLINQNPSSFLGEFIVDIATLVIGLYFILFFIVLGVNSLMAIFRDGGKTLFRIMKNYAEKNGSKNGSPEHADDSGSSAVVQEIPADETDDQPEQPETIKVSDVIDVNDTSDKADKAI